MKTATFTLSLLSLLVVSTLSVQGQDFQPPAPEKEHEWLQQFVGEWTTHSKAEATPGQPAFECEGTIKSRTIGGLWVINEMSVNLGGATMGGLQTIGYDPEKKKYVGTWVDSMSHFIWRYEGSVDDTGKILTLSAERPNFVVPGKLSNYQDVYEFKSADEFFMASKVQGENGEWATFMTGTAKRTKK